MMNRETVEEAIGAGWIRKEVPSSTWTTKDGREIPIQDLEDGHLLNILRMLRRAAVQRVAARTVRALLSREPSGEMAQMAFEQEVSEQIDATWRDALPKQWPALYGEALRRQPTEREARAVHADDMIEMQFAIELSALTRLGRSR